MFSFTQGWDKCLNFLVLNDAISSRMELQMLLKHSCKWLYLKGIELKALLKVLAEVELKNLDCNCVCVSC